MDYIALNHNPDKPRGVFYNSNKPIGGIYYYSDPEKKVEVKTDENGITTAKVQVAMETPIIDDIPVIQESQMISEKLEEIKDQGVNLINRLTEEEKLVNLDYKILIQDIEVNFSQEGIERAVLSEDDRTWLSQAQNYFITAQQDGSNIGSAEDFTTTSVLEALWSVAQAVGINPKRFIVQMYNESRFNPYAKGLAGERGIGQFKESTAQYYGYDWGKISGGITTYPYQAKASAELIKKIGEIAYNSKSAAGEKYQDKIDDRIIAISKAPVDCVLKNLQNCL